VLIGINPLYSFNSSLNAELITIELSLLLLVLCVEKFIVGTLITPGGILGKMIGYK
jgi:hypothetical protein